MTSESKRYDVIVVGGGISGLSSAKFLTDEGLDVLLLEARDRPGGRAWTHRVPNSDKFADMGGAYFGRHQTKVLELAKSLGLHFYKLPLEGYSIISYEGENLPYEADSLPINSVITGLDVNSIFKTLDAYSQQVPLHKPWEASKAKEWDNISVEDYLQKTCWTRMSFKLMTLAFSQVFGAPNRDVSFLFALQSIRSCGGIRALFGSKHGLQEMKIVEGSNSISERLSEKLNGKINYNSTVCKIVEDPSKDVVVVYTADGQTFRAERVVIAMAPPVLQNIDISPPLPPSHQEFINLRPVGHGLKTAMYYDKAHWKDKGFNGEMVSDHGIGYTLPDTKFDGRYPAIMGFVDSESDLAKKTQDERKTEIAEQYARVWGIEELKNPIGYLEKNWMDEEETRLAGVSVYSLPPKFLTKNKSFWGEQRGRLHFAGVESSDIFNGYMDGGVRSAERVTREIVTERGGTVQKLGNAAEKEPPYLPASPVEVMMPSIPLLCMILMVGLLVIVWLYLQSYDIPEDPSDSSKWDTQYTPADTSPPVDADPDFDQEF